MEKCLDNMLGLYSRGFITKETVLTWYSDISYVLMKEAADYFEIQFLSSILTECGIRYDISDDGYIYEDSESGGIDYFRLPEDTKVSLFLSLRSSSSKYSEVLQELEARGWGTNGKPLDNTMTRERSFSKNGYGLVRNKVGSW